MRFRFVFPVAGSLVGSTYPRQPTWYTSGDVKKPDAVMGANFAGLIFRNPLGVRELSKFENRPAVAMGNDQSSLDLLSR